MLHSLLRFIVQNCIELTQLDCCQWPAPSKYMLRRICYLQLQLVLGRTWFGSEVHSVFWGSVGSRFGFWDPNRGSVGSRFGFDRKTSKNHQFFLILFSKVRGSVRFLGGSVGSRFDFKEQIRGSVGSRFDFWRFGRFEVRYFKVSTQY